MSRHGFAYLFERFPSFTQTFCYREVAEMDRQGMRPLVFSIRKPDDFPHDCPPDLASAVHYLPPDDILTAQIKTLQSERRIPRAMNRILNDWGGKTDKHRVYAAAYLGPLLRQRGIRHVHVHFAGIAARTAYWLKRFYGISYSFTGHANDIFCETDFPVSIADLMREAALVVTVSDYSRQWLCERFPGEAPKIHRVYNGIDLGRFRTDARTVDLPRIVAVGRYVEKKGFEDLVTACGLLRKRGGDFECRIAGGGPLHEALEHQIAELGLKKQVRLLGPCTEDEVRDLLATAHLFVLPCIVEKDGGMDNLPTVIMEAMASGLPVVSTFIAGVPEMVTAGETGLLVAPRAPAELAAAMQTLLSDSAQARQFGAAGRDRATAQFAISATTRRLKHLLVRFGSAAPPLIALKTDRLLLFRWVAAKTGVGTKNPEHWGLEERRGATL